MAVAVIGVGMIGSALVKSLLKSGYRGNITGTDRLPERLQELGKLGVIATTDNEKAANEADIIILCVKPKDVERVLTEIRDAVKEKIVISFAAGLRLGVLRNMVPEAHLIRAMPNIAILVQESFTAYCADANVTPEDKSRAEEILSKLGRCIEMQEEHMDAITGLSGCGPAYLSIILEALTYAGLEVGLSKDVALIAAAQSMVGTGKLVLEAEKHPAEIRDMVTTPGGVTIEGLQELERVPIRHAFMKAIESATAKSRRISEALMTG